MGLVPYRLDSIENVWEALYTAEELFSIASQYVAQREGFLYPDYESHVREYIETLKKLEN